MDTNLEYLISFVAVKCKAKSVACVMNYLSNNLRAL